MLNFGNWNKKCALTILNSFGPANKKQDAPFKEMYVTSAQVFGNPCCRCSMRTISREHGMLELASVLAKNAT